MGTKYAHLYLCIFILIAKTEFYIRAGTKYVEIDGHKMCPSNSVHIRVKILIRWAQNMPIYIFVFSF